MTNRVALIFGFLFLSLHLSARDKVYFIKDSLKYLLWSGDSSVLVMAVSDSVRLPITEDSTLVIPASVTVDGRTYMVEGINDNGFRYRPEIKHVILSEGISFTEEYAFQQCVNLESVHFPTTFSWTDPSSFVGCSQLKSITVEDGNKEFDSRDNCNALIKTDDNELVLGCRYTRIPNGITTIGQCAFSGQRHMSGINIPEGIKKIDNVAFDGCTGLKHIILPSSLESIGGASFGGCTSLEELVIPANVSNVDEYIVAGCHNLKRIIVSPDNKTFDSRDNCNAIINTKEDCIVTGCENTVIPDNVKKIGPSAFSGSSLTRIFIPASIMQIAETAFTNCRFCTSIEVAPGNPVYDSRENCNAVIETSTGTLVKGCARTTFPSDVSRIGNYAFSAMVMPSYYVIPEGIVSIGHHAFSSCNFRFLMLPESLKEIENSTFTFCMQLEEVEMNSTDISIGAMAFNHCYSLRSVRLPQRTRFANSEVFHDTPYQEIYEREYGKP